MDWGMVVVGLSGEVASYNWKQGRSLKFMISTISRVGTGRLFPLVQLQADCSCSDA